MKQETNESQTAKLIELGFVPKPKIKEVRTVHSKVVVDHDCYFTIGELLSFLPETIESEEDDFAATFQMTAGWELYYTTYSDIFYYCNNRELIDALFAMVINLKEAGVI